ncbi:ABC transporter permease [Janibacter alkaliphilus]|uniref:ABC-2 type transport system permease protein n=1 Tax=Janibacter alkaliphilus TaxID=1069963 RepID=A0A852X8C1_9MICO|nr:ABC transporter permease [Janibacter alkaliphilus]NYG38667.1 ABC-2 type transport system permease protein [Janibacter alkaliphilus]
MTTTDLPAVRPGIGAWWRLAVSEGKIVARDTPGLVIPLGMPVLIMVMTSLGVTEEDRADSAAAFGGMSALEGYVVPLTLTMVMALVGVVNMPSFLATHRRTGVLRRLSASPAHPMMVLVAQVLVSIAQSAIGIGLAVGTAVLAFDVELPENPLATLGTVALTAAAMYAIGMIVAAVSPTPSSSVAIGLVTFFAIMALGGGFGSRDALPDRLAEIGGYLPFGAGIDVIGAAWVGTVPDGDQLLALAVTGVVGLLVGVRLFRWQ